MYCYRFGKASKMKAAQLMTSRVIPQMSDNVMDNRSLHTELYHVFWLWTVKYLLSTDTDDFNTVHSADR